MNNDKLEKLYDEIVQANIIRKADDNQNNQGQPVSGNPVSTPEPPKNNAQPEQPKPAGTNTAPTAQTAPTAASPSKPKQPNNQNTNNTANNNNKPQEEENKTIQTNQPPQANKPPEPNRVGADSVLNKLISIGIDEAKHMYSDAVRYYMQPNIKTSVLSRVIGRNVAIKFAGSKDVFPAMIDNDTYAHYVKAGMETIYVPLDKNEQFFTFTIKNANKEVRELIVEAMSPLYRSGYINGFECIHNGSKLDVICYLDDMQETTELPQMVIEATMDIDNITIELPDINRLCVIPESIFRKPTSTIRIV